MTNREFYNAIINTASLSDEIRAHAERELTAMDTRNEKRKSTPTKSQKENVAHSEKLFSIITDEPKTAAQYGEVLELSTNKVAALLKPMVDSGKVVKVDIKVKGEAKKTGYKLA